jgi:glutathione reductase (NADPH)
MWYAADTAERLRSSESAYKFRSGATQSHFNWAEFKVARDAYVKMLNGAYARNFDREGVEYHWGWGRVKSKNVVEVKRDDGSTYELTTDKIFITVGGRPTIPSEEDVPGAEYGITSDGFFDLTEQPKSVAVVGAGYIAVELAGIFHTLGTETHLLIRGEKVLRKFDTDIQDTLTDWMEHSGVQIHTATNVVKVEGERKGGPVTIHTKDGNTLKVDLLLWAVGRVANTADVGLKENGVQLNEKNGDVKVDEYQTSSVPNIFALGDVSGEMLLTPVAIAAGRRLGNRLFGPPKFKDQKLDYNNIPTVVFSCVFVPPRVIATPLALLAADLLKDRHPTIGTVGLTEAEARNKYGDRVKVCEYLVAPSYHDLCLRRPLTLCICR